MEEELSEHERGLVASLATEIAPRPALEKRVVRDLRQAGLMTSARRGMTLAVAAALTIGFFAGLIVHRFPVAQSPGREFILLIHDTPSMRVDGDEPRRIREYSEWARGLRDKLVEGEKLTDEISSVGAGNAQSTVGGFFRIRARDRAEADAIARSCPHVRYGGRIEVREIQRI